MTQQTVQTRIGWSDIKKLIDGIPHKLSSSSAGRDILLKVGEVLLGKIRESFIAKSSGGTDEAGDRWAPLKPTTVAYRHPRGKRESARNERPSQALTKKQQARWWELYRQGLAIHQGNKGRAARRAWTIIKGEGAQTLLNKYGNRKVQILNSSGQLLASLSPGSNSPHQILRVERGRLEVGTNRDGAMAHHKGSKKRGLPQRKLWPDKFPASWWKDILAEVQKGIAELVSKSVKG